MFTTTLSEFIPVLVKTSYSQLMPKRPANILLSTRKVPVLVDFGFAERYEVEMKNAFLSNLAYGTPEVRPAFVADKTRFQ